MEEKIIVAGYVRVSTDSQKEGYSLSEQRSIIKRYYDQKFDKNQTELKIYEDGGYSGLNLKRPGIKEIITLSKLKLVDSIIFISQDRLTRNPIDAYMLVETFKKENVKIHCVLNQVDLNSVDGNFLFQLNNLLSNRESKIISERTKRGLDGKARNNEYPYSNLPLGIERLKDGQIIHNSDINIVKDIYRLYVRERERTENIQRIIQIKYPNLNLNLKNGYITRLLKNTLYRGYFCRTTSQNEKMIVNVITPIFSEEDISKIDTINRKIKNKSVHRYQIRNKVFFEDNSVMNHCTQHKTLKIGIKKQYKYYYNKDTRIYINENKIIKELLNQIKLNTKSRDSQIQSKMAEIDELFLNNIISKEQYKQMVKKIKKSAKITNQISKIIVNKKREIQVIF